MWWSKIQRWASALPWNLRKTGSTTSRRRSDPADRRRVEVHPSSQSLTLARRIYGPLAAEGVPLLGRYNRAQLELLVDVLRRMQALQERHTERVKGSDPRPQIPDLRP